MTDQRTGQRSAQRPNPKTLAGKRDLAILPLLIGCGLRRAELLRLEVKDLQQREACWMLPDLVGKGKRVRTVTVPTGVKARIDGWTPAAGITEGRLFRPVTKADAMTGTGILAEKDVWRLIVRYARETNSVSSRLRPTSNLRETMSASRW